MHEQVYQAINDVIVAAFMCDTSRIAVANIDEDFSSYVGDWHQDVAHHAVDPDGVKQGIISAAHQLTFDDVFLDLCNKLDVDDGSGKTYLDSALVDVDARVGRGHARGPGHAGHDRRQRGRLLQDRQLLRLSQPVAGHRQRRRSRQ